MDEVQLKEFNDRINILVELNFERGLRKMEDERGFKTVVLVA